MRRKNAALFPIGFEGKNFAFLDDKTEYGVADFSSS